ncbi:SGNH/GDSL hydrolase family protein [Saccharococcus caldoxylosilyticus]|uniref:SGNH hydrolase-type esterase domain-containing protein n=1 Tax=Saccharococcus caldoxylosilyticus TaxID=81408 RepID=A0A150M3R6_9BACL|nr:SGNH/GDSL hydrolase family protein [Parageobacillus caldoxylosilyticus]KYD19065.1 hypothetical protein B4119_3895 [Parageobacillus caldoxylosilyticus]
MRNVLLAVLLVISCTSFIVAGHLYWQKKIDNTVRQAVTEATEFQVTHEQEAKRMAYAKKLPAEVQAKIKRAIETNRPLRLVIAGSEATPASKDGWPALFEQQLDATYGNKVFQVVVKEYKGMTTKQAIEENIAGQLIKEKPDIVLWEPFLLNNNGVININDTFQHIDAIIQTITDKLPDVTILLQPPHPIYNATYYPEQVKQFQAFAKEKGYIYIDHWKAWPDYKSNELNKYVDPDTDLPTKDGQKRWADFLADYFIAK